MFILIPIIGFIIFIYSIILHEIAHGLAADALGDPTARLSGRLTLNPLPHIDPVMSLLFPLLLYFSHSSVIFGAAKPVPIDPYNLRNPRKDMGLVGLAGPGANFLLAIIFALVARVANFFGPNLTLLQILANAAIINIALGVFNLIPVPPLDGGRVATALLPERYARALASLENLGILIVLFLLLFPNSFFSLQRIIFQITIFLFNLIFPGISML